MARSHPAAPPDDDAHDHDRFIAGQDPVDVAAATWLVRRQDGLTPEEEAELQAWLDEDPAHAAALARLEGLWGRLDEVPEERVDALRTGLAPAAAPARQPATPPRAWPRLRDLLPSWPAHPGAAWALGLAMVVGWVGWETWQRLPTYRETLATVRGEQREVRLPDGSTLWLDTATRTDVALYRTRREVVLPEGRAQFAVQPDASRPFEVRAGALRITVVGTRFAVRHTAAGPGGASVTVEEGHVRVAVDGPDVAERHVVDLTAGQSVAIDTAGRLGAVSRQVASAPAWREGRVDFDGVPLAEALAEFERYGPTRLVVSDPSVATLRVHGSYDHRRLDAFARALPQVLPVRLKPRPDGFTEIVPAEPR